MLRHSDLWARRRCEKDGGVNKQSPEVFLEYLAAPQADEIMDVMGRAFRPEFGEAWTIEQCRATLLLPGTRLVVARLHDQIAGFALFMTVMDTSELLLLAVDPDFHYLGIGKQLIREWERWAVDEGVDSLFLEVRDGNPAFGFYQYHGFSEIGRRKNYYRGENGKNIDAITMVKN